MTLHSAMVLVFGRAMIVMACSLECYMEGGPRVRPMREIRVVVHYIPYTRVLKLTIQRHLEVGGELYLYLIQTTENGSQSHVLK
jgi:hypothetical protein